MNIAMEETSEWVGGVEKNRFGDAFIRGNNGELTRGRSGEREGVGGESMDEMADEMLFPARPRFPLALLRCLPDSLGEYLRPA